MIRRQQPRLARDDAMPVVIRVARESHVEAALLLEQHLHRIRRGRVHANLPVPIDAHEAEGWIDLLIDDGQVQAIAVGNRPPVVNTGTVEQNVLVFRRTECDMERSPPLGHVDSGAAEHGVDPLRETAFASQPHEQRDRLVGHPIFLQRREDLFVCQVARRAEEHKSV